MTRTISFQETEPTNLKTWCPEMVQTIRTVLLAAWAP